MKHIGVLASGGGSNFQAIIDAIESGFIPSAGIAVLLSDKPDAYALTRAEKHNIGAKYVNPKEYATREEYGIALADILESHGVDIVCLAGYMRIISPAFVSRFPNRILNIHPALLPSFPGLHAQKQALDYGVKVTGCTVHLVDEQVDHGPIIVQEAVPVMEDDTVETLSERILGKEHEIYPLAIKWLVEGRLEACGRRIIVSTCQTHTH
jgi:phosphoribosylglycinamide formyltransferase 1